jgi:hypothetical protein
MRLWISIENCGKAKLSAAKVQLNAHQIRLKIDSLLNNLTLYQTATEAIKIPVEMVIAIPTASYRPMSAFRITLAVFKIGIA